MLPFLTLYLTEELGETPGDAGLVLAAYGLGALITAPFVGKLSDKIGAMRLMQISMLGSGVLFFLFSFLENYWFIFSLSVLLAVINESFRPASMAFISDSVEAELRKPAFALYRLAINLGMSIGPILGGFLTAINYSLLFYADGITCISAGIYLLLVKWDLPQTEEDELEAKSSPAKNLPPVYRDWKFLYFLLAMVPVGIVMFQLMSTLPLFLVNDLGYAKTTFGFVIAVNTVMIIIIELPLNTLMNKWSDWKLLLIGSLLTGIGFGGMAVLHSMPGIIITVIIWTFGEMILFPAGASYAAELSPKGKRGEYMGYYQLMFSICFTLGPWLGTVIFEEFGSFTLWIGTFMFGLISTIMMLKLKSFVSNNA